MGIGELSALGAALLWTISSMFWRELRLSAWTINLAKNILGTLLLGAHLLISAQVFGAPLFEASLPSVSFLAISGLIGIVIGDTLYFRSLQILGPRRALMVATTSPLFSIVLAWTFANQQLLASAVMGIFLTIAGVVIVVADRKAHQEAPSIFPGQTSVGVLCGIGGAICQAVGGILSQRGMSDCSGLEASFYRVSVAMLSMVLLYGVRGNLNRTLKSVSSPALLRILIPATIIGTWMGIWFSQIAYKNSDAAIAQTLLSTCPLFSVPIIFFVDRQKISVLSILGSVIAIIGVYLVVK